MAKKVPAKRPAAPAVRKPAVLPGQFALRAVQKAAVQVKHLEEPPKYTLRASIHPRRILPRTREGMDRAFLSASRQVMLDQPMQFASPLRSATDDVVIVTNTELTQPGQQQLASNVGEPSVAVSGNVVVYTGNWYAARSVDGGQTFEFMDPFRDFPAPKGLGFCCDQVVNYLPSIDMFVWLMQYGPTVQGAPQKDNLQRLAFAKTADVQSGKWTLFDLTTADLGVSGLFLDYPDLAVGANSLYITTNIFTPDGVGAGAAVVRIPIASIAAGAPTAQKFVASDPNLNSFRVAQNCGTRAFFATHNDTSTLNVFTWDEGQATPQPNIVEVARWVDGQGFTSRTPDGQRWLDRADSRITGATMAGSDLYFSWGVNAGSANLAQPFVQVARIDSKSLTLLDNINVFDPDSAICYGGLSTNVAGEVGISYMIGGGPRFPSHAVGILTGNRKDIIVAAGERGPLPSRNSGKGEWGDYLTVRPVFPERQLFAATGYTLQGAGDGSNRDSTPRFVTFGRSSGSVTPGTADATGKTGKTTKRPKPPVPTAPLPTTPAVDGGPIRDVNLRAVVAPATGLKIKQACGMGSTILQAELDAMNAAEAAAAPQADKPGTERWFVKTGQDQDRAKVGKNVVLKTGVDLGAGIVEATLEEMVSLPRPLGLENPKLDPPQFSKIRDGQTEVTIWRITAKILAVKHEADGDYHLVLQGASGAEMVGEIPTPTTAFVGDSPWLVNIGQARQQIDDKLIRHLAPAAFAIMNDKFVPNGSMMFNPQQTADPAMSFVTPPQGSNAIQPLFQTAVAPTPVRLTGVGFFDRAHGALGASPNVVELHPILKVEFL